MNTKMFVFISLKILPVEQEQNDQLDLECSLNFYYVVCVIETSFVVICLQLAISAYNYSMDQLLSFFIGNTPTNYVQAGFSEREAEAIAWIADQKPKGKFYGFLAGSFMALSWGHWHNRIFGHFGIKCNKIYTQLAILGSFIAFGDYLTCSQRYGANEYVANNLYLNNNLFIGNLQSLIEKFQVLNRKFTAEQVKTFNQRARAFKSQIPLEQRKWIFNPNIESQQEFERRRKLNISAPWEDAQIREAIKAENIHREEAIVYGPKELGKLIDETGQKLGIVKDYTFGWRPLYTQSH